MTGLSVDTLRAWERRHRVVKPARSARGRSYDDSEVKRFQLLRAATGFGYAIGQIASLSDKELEELASRKAAPVQRPPADGAHIEAAIAAVESFDSARLGEELGRLAALLSPAEFVYEVAMPLMRTVGERWHAGSLQIAQEHLATESVRSLLGAMSRLNRPGEEQPRLLATTPSGELHDLGVLAGAVLAGAQGFRVASLGPSLPSSDILFAVERYSPQILLVGMTTPNPLPAAITTLREVVALMPASTELWLGGRGALIALDEADRPGTVYFDDLQTMERLLEERRRERSL